MGDNLPFWQEVSSTWLPRNLDHRAVLMQMPERLSAEEVLPRMQSVGQLADACTVGRGYINGELVLREPSKALLEAGLRQGPLPENLWFQIFYQFCIAEGVSQAFADKALRDWPVPFLQLMESIFQFLVFMSTALYIADGVGWGSEKQDSMPDKDWIIGLEPEIKKVLSNTIDIICSKGADYGQGYRRHGLAGLLPRIWDKMARYMQLKSAETVNYESRQDSARDLLGYSIIGWSLLLELESLAPPQPMEGSRYPEQIYSTSNMLHSDISRAVEIVYPDKTHHTNSENNSWSAICACLAVMGWRKSAPDIGSSEF